MGFIKRVFILYVIMTTLLMILIYNLLNTVNNSDEYEILKINNNNNTQHSEKQSEMKYILQWTPSKHVPFVYMGEGQAGFLDRNCEFTNCFVTSDRKYFDDYTKFDVIVFNGPEVLRMSTSLLPNKRVPNQKYVFGSIESAANYPICNSRFNGYFNWTWTYRLDSEVQWGYMIVRDSDGKVIGPKREMNWIKLEDMDPVSDDLKAQLRNKTKAAAWFVSNCHSKSKRDQIAKDLQVNLEKHGLSLDIYGRCGKLSCGRDKEDDCDEMLERDYYFYLSFENSFSEDYATEKLARALKYNAIPIVYGGANYTRFMPDGIYLDIRELGAEKLAEKMKELIANPDQYAEYFKWKKYYKYYYMGESSETIEYCKFCTILNNEAKMKEVTVYEDFQKWWNPLNSC